jgi:ABC-2 type transport system permease protein
VLVFDMRIGGDAWALAPLIVAFSICLVFLGVCVTALCRTAQQAGAFAYLGMVLFGAIGGAFVPIDLLPTWARVVAPATPTYWAMRGMRSVVLDGRGVGSIALPSAVLLGMSVVFALVALRRLRFDETKTGWN